jgi:hypothetical protein
MRNSALIAFAAAGLTIGFGSESFGQLTVQQPVLQSTGGNFAVSVPDRGGVLLGSVSRAGESRKSYGLPFSRGSSVGRFSQHSSLSSHVWIHDLREMDQMILDMADKDPQGQRTATNTAAQRAGLAWSNYQPRRGVSVEDRRPSSSLAAQRFRSNSGERSVAARSGGADGGSRSTSIDNKNEPAPASRNRALDPDHSYRLGVEAEESGKVSLAKLHYLAAAQYGSVEGARRLRELATQPIVSK